MTKNKNEILITHKQHEILLGIILGDGHLELAPNGKSARLLIEQSQEKKFDVEHLRSVFLDWSPGEIRVASGKRKNNYAFSTKYSITLLAYHQRFYKDKKRIIPTFAEKEFTARSFTYLYMDDGGIKSKDSKGVYINTYSLPEKDQKCFCGLLEKEFQLQAKVVRDRKDPRIYISGYSYEAFIDLIDPFLLPGFSYKIPAPRSEKSRFRKKS